jgi:carboxyl-terminal processing protease
MDDVSAVILSVAKYYSPSGKSIQDAMVTPSVPVQESEAVALDDDGNPLTPEPAQPASNEDLLLKKAIDVVMHGKTDVVSNSAGDSKQQPGPALTPLNVPRPVQPPPEK